MPDAPENTRPDAHELEPNLHGEQNSARGSRALWISVGVAILAAVGVVLAVALAPRPQSASIEPTINGAVAQALSINQLTTLSTKAPPIALTDQRGNPVTLAQFEGKSIVLTFDDDQCQDLCTLFAQDVLAANTDMGSAAQNVVFLSINANPYYPHVTSVRQWTDNHGLGNTSNWFFATGTTEQLSATWNAYDVTVKTDPTTKSVTHGAEMFFIDPSGHERYVGEFGTQSANTSLFASATASVAVGLLPDGDRVSISMPARSATASETSIGQIPAPISLPSLGTDRQTSTQSGKFTVLNFWASNCSACIAETPAIEQAYLDVGSDYRFYGIDVSDTQRLGQAFAQNAGVTYPELADRSGTVAGEFQITGLPYTVILAPNGKVVVRHGGAFTSEQLDYLLHTLAAQYSE